MTIPITLVTGYLGSGKTTIILNAIKEIPKDYKIAYIKNEYGTAEVDSALADDAHISVKEIVNGCLCCVLVGKFELAIQEFVEKEQPDRIIVETSGSAYPLPLILQINKNKDLSLDGVIDVIDCKNFHGYINKSLTAIQQAQQTDLILLNKHEGLSDTELENILDEVYELNPDTPKVKTKIGNISYDLIIGLDSKLADMIEDHHHPEHDHHHHEHEVDVFELTADQPISKDAFAAFIKTLDHSYFYRIKGFLNTGSDIVIANIVNGTISYHQTNKKTDTHIVCIGPHINKFQKLVEQQFAKLT